MKIELHCHTTASDGRHTPEEIVELARAAGLSALAITDHDTTAGIRAAREAARGQPEIIPGIEISCYQNREIHVLGYFLDPDDPALTENLASMRTAREHRVRAMLEQLQAVGITLSLEQVLEQAGSAILGRPHVARALVAAGHVSSFDDAFERFIGAGKPGYVVRRNLTPVQAAAVIRRAGGVAVLAHPGLYQSDALVSEILKGGGFSGLEAHHHSHDPKQVRRYKRLARRLGLIATGGSDYHGPEPAHKPSLGQIPVPPETVELLRQAAGLAAK
ncbi:MAG: PHP domain-containing protein [Armatimonadetes bacterium]|nr:PHP domain-containing protein [Armatimonadota bacterium]